jgi:hypothetical protein
MGELLGRRRNAAKNQAVGCGNPMHEGIGDFPSQRRIGQLGENRRDRGRLSSLDQSNAEGGWSDQRLSWDSNLSDYTKIRMTFKSNTNGSMRHSIFFWMCFLWHGGCFVLEYLPQHFAHPAHSLALVTIAG